MTDCLSHGPEVLPERSGPCGRGFSREFLLWGATKPEDRG